MKYFNAQCLYSKFTELADLLSSQEYDIIAVTETWFDSNIKESKFKKFGYSFFAKPRSWFFYTDGTFVNEARGGVLILVQDELNPVSFDNGNDSAETIWCKVQPKKLDPIIFVVYIDLKKARSLI